MMNIYFLKMFEAMLFKGIESQQKRLIAFHFVFLLYKIQKIKLNLNYRASHAAIYESYA